MDFFWHCRDLVLVAKEILHAVHQQTRVLLRIEQILSVKPVLPTTISFKEIYMNPEGPGVTQVWTGTLSPAGSAFAADTTFTVTPSDPTVSATVDSTGLIVTIAYPDTFVPNPTSPFSVAYSAASASNPTWSLSATITPSVPVPLPTAISFVQTQ